MVANSELEAANVTQVNKEAEAIPEGDANEREASAGECGKVKEKKLSKVRKKKERLLEEANLKQQEEEKSNKKQAGKANNEIITEKHEGEGIGKHETVKDGKVNQKKEGEVKVSKSSKKRRLLLEEEEEKAKNSKQDGREGEVTNSKKEEGVVKKKRKGEAIDKHNTVVNQEAKAINEGGEATEVRMNKKPKQRKLKHKVEEDSKEEEEANHSKQVVEEADIAEQDGCEAGVKPGKVIIQMQEGETIKAKKKKSKQKVEETNMEEVIIKKQEGGAILEKREDEDAIIEDQGAGSEKQLNGAPNGVSQTAPTTRGKIMSLLRQFLMSQDKEYTFDANLTKSERAMVHMLCSKMGMRSKSSGGRRRGHRRVSVFKRGTEGEKTGKKMHMGSRSSGVKQSVSVLKRERKRVKKEKKHLTCFKFSEEANDVSQNLFMVYPPYDCELGDKMVGELGGKTNRSRKADPFFRRPTMSKFNIRKKVESLASKVANDLKLKQITEKRSKLPIASFRDAITSTLDSHQVVLISGETGCGKTTQVPQYILEHIWGKGETCKIICTQPRRISAMSVAERISRERGEDIGDSVGYKIKLESRGGMNSSIIFCTTGVLLRVLVAEGRNKTDSRTSSKNDDAFSITHIIVDEVHERDRFSDLLLAIIRDFLPSYPNIRIVLMSATIDAERFSQYFGGCPVIRVPGLTYPVQTFYLEDVLSILKSNDNNHLNLALRSVTSEDPVLSEEYRHIIDDAINLAWSSDEYEPLLDLVSSEGGTSVLNSQHSSTGVTPLMVFARKGRVGDICMILSLGADCLLQDNDGATALEWAKRENQGEAAEVLKKQMEINVINSEGANPLLNQYLATVNSQLVDVVLIEQLLRKICSDSSDGAILVFLAGWDDIRRVIDKLQANPFFKDVSKFLISPLHSKVPSIEQKKVFERPPPGCRKIILSTNIAESSVTIDDIVYVIDSGSMKEKSYDPYNNVSTLHSAWISKASAKQRAGRAGRCQAGICYHLYSKIREASFSAFQVPEIKRMPLDEVCLQVKLLDPTIKIGDFLGKLLDPPINQSMRNGIIVLQDIGALSSDEELTKLGEKLGSLPLHPTTSKMLLFSILLNCLDPALTLACASGYRDPFILPSSLVDKRRADAAKVELASLYGGHGDQFAVIAAYECWNNAREKGQEARFCSEYFVNPGTMKMLFRMRKQLQLELFRKGYIPEDASCCNLNAHDPGIRGAVLVAGLYPRVGRLLLPRNGKRSVVETASGEKVRLSPRSASFRISSSDSADQPLVVFDEIMYGDWGANTRCCSVIGTLPLLMLAHEIVVTPLEEDEDVKDVAESECPDKDTVDDCEMESSIKGENTIMSAPDNKVTVVVDRWLTFESTALDVAQIYCLRERLSAATLFAISNPRIPLPEIFGVSIHAITRILSYDGLSGISSKLKYGDPQTPESGTAETGQSVLVQNTRNFPTSLLPPKMSKLDNRGRALESGETAKLK